jgi:hypothetical protein
MAARQAFEQQVTQLLQEELAVARHRKTGWFRQRAVSTRTLEA